LSFVQLPPKTVFGQEKEPRQNIMTFYMHTHGRP